jgi:hypothetical protein
MFVLPTASTAILSACGQEEKKKDVSIGPEELGEKIPIPSSFPGKRKKRKLTAREIQILFFYRSHARGGK